MTTLIEAEVGERLENWERRVSILLLRSMERVGIKLCLACKNVRKHRLHSGL